MALNTDSLTELLSNVEKQQLNLQVSAQLIAKNQRTLHNEVLMVETYLRDFMSIIKLTLPEHQRVEIAAKVNQMVSNM